MRRSPLNTPRGFRGFDPRHTPYNWKLYENANDRGYHSTGSDSSQRFSVNDHVQPRGDDFIPLSAPPQHSPHTPVTRRDNHSANWHSSPNERDNASPRGWHNYRGNYHGTPRLNYNNRYNYKHPGRKFHGQSKMDHKTARRQHDISLYIDMESILEDPWADLVKKLNDSKRKSEDEMTKSESAFSATSTDCESTRQSECKSSRNTDLDDAQCNQDSKNVSSVDTSCVVTDLCEMSKIDNLTDSKADDTCLSQDSVNENTGDADDEASETMQEEDNICSNASAVDTNQKDIDP